MVEDSKTSPVSPSPLEKWTGVGAIHHLDREEFSVTELHGVFTVFDWTKPSPASAVTTSLESAMAAYRLLSGNV